MTKKNRNTNPTVDQIIARARTMKPSARADFLRRHDAAEIAAIHERLVGAAKPKTPRPVLERKILTALSEPAPAAEPEPESKPLEEAVAESPTAAANAASWDKALPEPGYVPRAGTGDDAPTASDAADGAPEDDAATTAAGDGAGTPTGESGANEAGAAKPERAPRERDPRLPPVGTVIIKKDRQGAERARCTVVDGGVEYAGTTYKSISSAAMAAAKAIGLASKTQDGYAFWGLKKGAARAAKKDAVESLQKAWERYRDHAAGAAKVEGADERAKVHAKVVQNQTTQRTQRTPFAYLLFYLGDKPLDALLRRSEINTFVEALKEHGPLTFTKRKDGKPTTRKKDELKHATINKCLGCLKALLNLAHVEDVIKEQPRIDMLPQDDSTLVVPPTDDEIRVLLLACEDYRGVAPLLPEVVDFASETGLRRAELFHLTWRSVEMERDAIRIETQAKSRVVNGKIWKPKHGKHRIVPLSKKAKAILEQRLVGKRPPLDEPVFPNRGGCPYERMDGAGKDAGSGWFHVAVEAAGLKGRVTFHGLRHLFAVRLLTRGVPITVVSELLGHSHIEITVKRYGRYASDAKVKWDAVRVLDRDPNPPVAPPAEGAPNHPPAVDVDVPKEAPQKPVESERGGERGRGRRAPRATGAHEVLE